MIPRGLAAPPDDDGVNCSQSSHQAARRRRHATTHTLRRRSISTRRCRSLWLCPADSSWSRRWTRCSPCRSRTVHTWDRESRTRNSPAPRRSEIPYNVVHVLLRWVDQLAINLKAHKLTLSRTVSADPTRTHNRAPDHNWPTNQVLSPQLILSPHWRF